MPIARDVRVSIPDNVDGTWADAHRWWYGHRSSCTFEVLLERCGISDRALRPIAEIVHDIDLKDAKFGREEMPGLALVINAICTANKEDTARLERATLLFDDLYEFFRKR